MAKERNNYSIEETCAILLSTIEFEENPMTLADINDNWIRLAERSNEKAGCDWVQLMLEYSDPQPAPLMTLEELNDLYRDLFIGKDQAEIRYLPAPSPEPDRIVYRKLA